MKNFKAKWERFWLEPASALPLAVLRIGVAATLLLQAWYLAPVLTDLYGEGSVLQRQLGETVSEPYFGVSFWLGKISALGLSADNALFLLAGLYLTSLLFLLAGWKTRGAAAVAWLLHLWFTHGQTTSYGLDIFAHVALFFLVFMPSADAYSLDRGRVDLRSPEAGISLRVLQIYLCIAYFFSGLEKALGTQWWSGEAVWRSVNLPSLAQYDLVALSSHPWVLMTSGWGTIAVEMGYAFLIWPRRTRGLWLALTIAMHLGIALFLGLWLFSLIMAVLNIAAFGSLKGFRKRAAVPREVAFG